MAARGKLIEHNLRLVAHIVKKYYSMSKNQDDLISIGTIGLIKAIDSFDSRNGTRFATYASKCLQNEILMYFRSQKKTACEVSISEPIDIDKDGNPLTYIDVISTEDTIADDIDCKIKTSKAKKAIHGAGRKGEGNNHPALRAFRLARDNTARGCGKTGNITLVCFAD